MTTSGHSNAGSGDGRSAETSHAAAWLIVAQASALGLGFAMWAYAARVITPAAFGEIQMGIAVGTYLALLVTIGLGPLAVAEFTRHAQPRRYISRIAVFRFAHALAVGSVLLATSAFFHEMLPLLVTLPALSVLVRQLWPEWADIALGAPRRVMLVRTTFFGVALCATLHFVRSAHDALALAWILVLAGALAAGSAWLLTANQLRRFPEASDRDRAGMRWRPTMRRALPLGAGDILGQLLANADLLLLGLLSTREAVAHYGAAYRIILAVQGAGVALRYASLKVLAAPTGVGQERFERRLLEVTLYGSVGIAAVAALTAPYAMSLTFGARYESAGPILSILVWTWPFDFCGAIVLNMLIVRGCRRQYISAMTAAAMTNISANLVLIPYFGTTGAALCIVGSLALLLVLAARYVSRQHESPTSVVQSHGAALAIAGVCGSLAACLHLPIVGQAVLAFVALLAAGRLAALGSPLPRLRSRFAL